MVFSSLFFLFVFLPLNLILYYILPFRAWKNGVLIGMSLIFYAWGEPIWVFLLIFSATIDYIHGRLVEKYRGKWQSKAAVASSLILNLGLLVIFKYSGMMVETINQLLGIGLQFQGFSLPIGISFYTFQTISYVIDVYRGEAKAQKSYFKFLMFVSLFHQLVAGPIVRYKDVAYEIDHRRFEWPTFANGIERFVIGLGKKVVLANTAGDIGQMFLEGDFSSLSLAGHWLGMLLYAFQIYYDFSGYSDMAIGLGKMFGFNYKENFNYPYISRSASEFWRRWHISLGSFFRDYLYIPLGGNRRYVYRNLLIVWFLTGLWHGASWNYVLWGLYYGVLIAMERSLKSVFPKFKLPALFSYIYMLIVTIFGWTLFYFEDMTRGISYMKGYIAFGNLWDTSTEIILMNNIFFLILAAVCATPILKNIGNWISSKWQRSFLSPLYNGLVYPIGLMAVLVVSCILLVGQTYNPFLYFRF